jgi:hypothetical protein
MESETAADAAPEEAEGNGAVSHATMEMIEGPDSGDHGIIEADVESDGGLEFDAEPEADEPDSE